MRLFGLGSPNVKKLRAKGDIRGLIRALTDRSDHVRSAAAAALGQIADPRAIEPLVVALKDSGLNVRGAAAEALGQIGDVRAVHPLVQTLKEAGRQDSYNDARKAAEALGKVRDVRAVEPLIMMLLETDDPLERWAAAKALARSGMCALLSH